MFFFFPHSLLKRPEKHTHTRHDGANDEVRRRISFPPPPLLVLHSKVLVAIVFVVVVGVKNKPTQRDTARPGKTVRTVVSQK